MMNHSFGLAFSAISLLFIFLVFSAKDLAVSKAIYTWSVGTKMPIGKIICYILIAGYLLTINKPALAASNNPSIYYGAVVANSEWYPSYLTNFETLVGKKVAIQMWYQMWQDDSCQDPGWCEQFHASWMDRTRNNGTIPMISWEPYSYYANTSIQPKFTLANIIAGNFDAYITKWAQDSKNWGHPYFLRFAHEMNANWFPWCELTNNNQAGQYIQAWKHVHDIFTSQGVTNVTWVWSPNIIDVNAVSPQPYYPGDTYVDWIAIDGYNWGTATGEKWQTFSQVFSQTYAVLEQLAPTKPMMLGEFASAQLGGSKSDWITDALTVQIPNNFPKIKAIIWFNYAGVNNFWIESSQESIDAFATAIALPIYADNSYSLIANSPIQPLTSTASPTPTPACRADLNKDTTVNLADLVAILGKWNQTGIGLAEDLNSDGKVNLADLQMVLTLWGQKCS